LVFTDIQIVQLFRKNFHRFDKTRQDGNNDQFHFMGVYSLRVVIYKRVSTKLQEHRFSLSSQTEELERYAKQQGWTVIDTITDVDSGSKFDKEGLEKLMDYAEEQKIDAVLCIDQNRLSRLDTLNWEYLKDILRQNKVKIAEPGYITDLEDEDQEFISDIKNLIAKRERKKIVRTMMRGKRQRTRDGKGWGKPPMEYLYDKNTALYSINDEWAWLIPFIDDQYLNQNKSDQSIAHELNKISKTPNGKNWSDTHVRQKLNNKAYHGVMEKSFNNGETITVENVYPPLRSLETYELIQEKRKNKFRRRPQSHPQLLRKTNMLCGYCGRKLSVNMSGDPKYSLHFYLEHSKKVRHKDQSVCGMKINMIRIEKNIIEALKSVLLDEKAASPYIQLEFDDNGLEKITKDLNQLNTQKNEIQAKIDRLLPLYLSGSFSTEELDKQKHLLDNQLEIVLKQIKQLKNKQKLIQKNMWDYDMVKDYLSVAYRFEVLLTKEQQMDMIGTLFPEGIAYGDCIKLTGSLPGDVPLDLKIPVDPDPYQVKVKARGSNNIASKLKEEDVLLIRQLHNEGKSYNDLAKMYDVNKTTIGAIVTRKNWTHL
jgi:site-specific DNA recombinase